MPAYLLDTGILIRHLRKRPGYRELVQRLNQGGDVYISAFTRVEVLRGMRDHERARTFVLLDSFSTHVIDRSTADQAGEWLRAWQARGILLGGPDAVIAASALQAGAALVTTNARHFPMPELVVLAADENGQITAVNH
ncbi:PIN domain-containing protein [Candidatus Amarolinea aalborgensis]|uniref:PIN domain-containing protein n=1 Tax=Candidatus Amarolinea aalborgensis TaxID=2249329 RepID=UPI003BF9925A